MVGVYDNTHILKIAGRIHLVKSDKVFIVIVRLRLTVLVYRASENCVCKRVAGL